MALSGKVCLVTGASRGIGKGIATALTSQGSKVYITGRSAETLLKTAAELGKNAIPVVCDHSKDDEIEKLFEQIKAESGKLDMLANNCFAGGNRLLKLEGDGDNLGKFWMNEPELWDTVNATGLRANYIASVYAARIMVQNKEGLIVNISSAGGLTYVMNVAYGVGKTAMDRMAQDFDVELKGTGVRALSVWPGGVKTELVQEHVLSKDVTDKDLKVLKTLSATGQTPVWVGQCVAALINDPKIDKKAGRVVWVYDIAGEQDIREVDGSVVTSHRSVKSILQMVGATEFPDYPIIQKVANFFPRWLVVPKVFYDVGAWIKSNKF